MTAALLIQSERCSHCRDAGFVRARCIFCNGTGFCKDPSKHPLLQPGEKFMGSQYGSELPPYLKGLETARLVQPAFDIDGEAMPDRDGYYALLVGSSEHGKYNRIMERRFSEICSGINHSK